MARLKVLALCLITIGIFVAAWSCAMQGHLDGVAARGQSPVAWVYREAAPQHFTADFPTSSTNFNRSSVMHIYLYAHRWLNWQPESVIPGFVLVEMIVLALAACALSRTLVPEQPVHGYFLLALLVVTSYARNMNLARFGQPFFVGQYYNFADAARLLAIACAVRQRWMWCGAMLGLCFTMHPTMGLMAGVFLSAAVAVIRPKSRRTVAGGLGVAIGIALLWLTATYSRDTVITAGVDLEWWVSATRLYSYHWYPFDLGVFTDPRESLLPFAGFLLLFGHYYFQRKERSRSDAAMVSGCVAAMALVIIGLICSLWRPSATMIKLSLHRANDLIIYIGLIYVAAGIARDSVEGGPLSAAVATVIFLSTVVVKNGYPKGFEPLLVAILVGLRLPSLRSRTELVVMAALGAAVVGSSLSVMYIGGYDWKNTFVDPFHDRLFSYGMGLLAIHVVMRLIRVTHREALSLVLLVGVTTYGVLAEYLLDPQFAGYGGALSSSSRRESNFRKVQEFARANTPPTSLVMVDPAMTYGWRDMSRRSSFGCIAEWIYAGWAYNSDKRIIDDGVARVATLGLRLDEYLPHGLIERNRQLDRLFTDATRAYNRASDEWRLGIATRYGVDYFLLRRQELLANKGRTSFPVAYENEDYVFIQVPANSK